MIKIQIISAVAILTALGGAWLQAESFAYCDKVYAGMTDIAGAPVVKFDAGGEGARVPVQMPPLTAGLAPTRSGSHRHDRVRTDTIGFAPTRSGSHRR